MVPQTTGDGGEACHERRLGSTHDIRGIEADDQSAPEMAAASLAGARPEPEVVARREVDAAG